MNVQGFGDVAGKLRRSTVQVVSGNRRSPGSGSGVIWTADGTVITNAHVVHEQVARVELWDGRSFPAHVAKRDDRADLAELKLNTKDLPSIAWRESTALRPGELVIAVGNPLGVVGALTTGVVHLSGPIRGLGRRPWIQAAIRLAPGNSGGPLADAEGRVIGINTMFITSGVVGGGIALAIPSDTVLNFLKRGSRPALGVVVRPMVDPVKGTGLLVLEVASNSPAEHASVMIGDLLIGANGRNFESADDLSDEIDESAGAILRLRFLRGDRRREQEVSVPLSRPQREAA